MLLSAVSVLVVAQSSSEIPEGLMNNPVFVNPFFLVSSTVGSDSWMSDVFVSNMKRLFPLYSLLKFISQKEVNYNGIYIYVPAVGRWLWTLQLISADSSISFLPKSPPPPPQASCSNIFQQGPCSLQKQNIVALYNRTKHKKSRFMFPSARTSKEAREVCNKLSAFLVTETKAAHSWPKSFKVCLVYNGRKSFWIQRLLKKFLKTSSVIWHHSPTQ